MPQYAVVTGASTGIGQACTDYLVKKGFRVFAGVRKDADAERLKAEIGEGVIPLIMDVTDAATLQAAAKTVSETLAGQTLAGLVCNAGIAVAGPLLHINVDEVETQLDVNVLGVIRTVQAFGPLLGADHKLAGPPGRIVMMSSVAGKMGAPFMGPYSASKHALEGLTKSLRKELALYGIECVIIGPGAVATPIWDKAEEIDVEQYKDTDYVKPMQNVLGWMRKRGPEGLPPEHIAKRVHHAITADKPKLRYAEVPDRMENWTIPRLLPERLVDKLTVKRIGLRPEDRD
ncbi:SDR family oxidoreductase [Hyphobacterium marinum]|uniref:SDR family oxidoreductase n=1 Tax=Hyphobacterium marinum TaxID=3116574 RepID=A0ABU7LVJ5_9PROT|nr:SDR family oxidoreductase [Hyphobacterium sp. Y6023]MEE2565572.1 SDR family oxidoreductase [Hyphobacterium sp. Y6023]